MIYEPDSLDSLSLLSIALGSARCASINSIATSDLHMPFNFEFGPIFELKFTGFYQVSIDFSLNPRKISFLTRFFGYGLDLDVQGFIGP